MSKICFTCGNELPNEAKFCNVCGTLLNEENSAYKDMPEPDQKDEQPHDTNQLVCPRCGVIVPPTAHFCRKCGAALHQEHMATEKDDEKKQAESDDDIFETYYSYYAGEDPEDSSDQARQNASEERQSGQNTSSTTAVNWKAIGSVLSTIITVALLIFFLMRHPVMDTKGIVFEDWGKVELGEAVEHSLTDVEWMSDKIGSKLYHVTVSGYSREWGCPISLTFEVNYSGDHVYAEAISGRWDGEYFSDVFSIAAAMATIYG